jgi:hypothetical protein
MYSRMSGNLPLSAPASGSSVRDDTKNEGLLTEGGMMILETASQEAAKNQTEVDIMIEGSDLLKKIFQINGGQSKGGNNYGNIVKNIMGGDNSLDNCRAKKEMLELSSCVDTITKGGENIGAGNNDRCIECLRKGYWEKKHKDISHEKLTVEMLNKCGRFERVHEVDLVVEEYDGGGGAKFLGNNLD